MEHWMAAGIDANPAAGTALHGRGICAVEELRKLRPLVRHEQLLDPSRMKEGIRADDVYAWHDRISPDRVID
jgi:hypothetical protein